MRVDVMCGWCLAWLYWDGTAEPVSADHEQDWSPYPVDPYSCYMCNHTIASFSPLYEKVPRLILKETIRLTQAVVFFRRHFLCGRVVV